MNRIVVFLPNKPFWGARIVQIPFFYGLRRGFPHHRIHVFSPVTEGRMFLDIGLADRFFQFPKKGHFTRIVGALRDVKPDLVFNLQHESERLNLVISLIPCTKIGYRHPITAAGFTHVVSNTENYRADHYLDLLAPLGLRRPARPYFEAMAERSELRVPGDRAVFTMIPAGDGDYKKWGVENYLSLVDRIEGEIPCSVSYFVLGPEEQAYEPVIMSRSHLNLNVLSCASMADIAKVCLASCCVVSNDCGPSHIAQLCGTPYVGIFAHLDETPEEIDARVGRWFRYGDKSRPIVAEKDQPITGIPVDRVWDAVQSLIAGTAASKARHGSSSLKGREQRGERWAC